MNGWADEGSEEEFRRPHRDEQEDHYFHERECPGMDGPKSQRREDNKEQDSPDNQTIASVQKTAEIKCWTLGQVYGSSEHRAC